MSNPITPSPTSPAGDERNPAAPSEPVLATPPFEERLREFWGKYRRLVALVCVAVVIAILGRGGWEIWQREKEQQVAADYAKATNSDLLKQFATENAGHALAGAAQLRLADEAYGAGKYSDAAAGYAQAAATLKDGPLAARARVGEGIAKVLAGDTAGGETALKAIVADLNQIKVVRAEAAFHVATLAMEAGRADEMEKYLEQIAAIDGQSLWAQRAMALRASRPAPPAPAATPEATAPSTPAVTFPGSGK